MKKTNSGNSTKIIIIGGIIIVVILAVGTFLMGQSIRNNTEQAVRTVSVLYLDELAGRREQVVENNLERRINDQQIAIDLMTEEDLSDMEHLQAYQARMKQLYHLDKFAFVDSDGLIYTSLGTRDNIDDYQFDYRTISEPEISILNPDSPDRKVVIATPVDLSCEGKIFTTCFMESEMSEMLSGLSMQSGDGDATFCNIYTNNGVALTNTVLGGLAAEDNLLDAMKNADMEEGYSYEKFVQDFENGRSGEVSFTYNGIKETLSYAPIKGTDWLLTYLIRESVIGDKISSNSNGIIVRSLIQSVLMILAMIIMFVFIIMQNRKTTKVMIEKETAEAENRVKQEEYEQRLKLQEKLLEEERRRTQQNLMIDALASDYRSVYYLEFDKDEGVCYQEHSDLDGEGVKAGEHFPYLAVVTAYADQYVTDEYREEFLQFVSPESLREKLRENKVVSFTYLVNRHGKESYEAVRVAGVRRHDEPEDGPIHNAGACFVDVDKEMRAQLAQQQTLSEALAAAEQANRAKTAFLSNMSHEIRTPMNAIIGLDNIAMNDPETTDRVRGYLEKIGDSADHLLNLINDILDVSRIESGRMTLKKEEFSFQKLLESVNTMFSGQTADKDQEYQCHIIGEVDDYYIGDNMKLRQVLINILGNAVKFTPSGGKVSLEVQCKAKYDGKSTLQFKISDNGIGMSKEFLPHLFDTFSQEDSSNTNKYGSSGLGMAITKNIVELMNGDIQVESEKGKGSTFTITVTLTDSDHKSLDENEKEVHPSEMSVLVIDDDPIACQHAQLVLGKAGITAEVATSGQEAVDMVTLRHARRNPYTLILVDWKMPEMDGIETTRKIRSIVGEESAIIILTAYRWDDVLDEAVQAGVDSFISKPLFAGIVMDEYKSAVQRKRIMEQKAKKKAELKGRKILLAEDVEINAEIMTMVLESREMEVELAVNGKIAVEKFSTNPEGYYDAILMDVRMPEMDGLEATRRIRALGKKDSGTIPIIALTANAFDEDVQRSLQAGMNAHLSKPVQPEVLFETLEGLL